MPGVRSTLLNQEAPEGHVRPGCFLCLCSRARPPFLEVWQGMPVPGTGLCDVLHPGPWVKATDDAGRTTVLGRPLRNFSGCYICPFGAPEGQADLSCAVFR